ncbi:hypothetical protein F4782DRAFT_479592 [Xylaria castorea]|nr:hypothetical protein F4782DRAFT_479592 [Xylaria castorea]
MYLHGGYALAALVAALVCPVHLRPRSQSLSTALFSFSLLVVHSHHLRRSLLLVVHHQLPLAVIASVSERRGRCSGATNNNFNLHSVYGMRVATSQYLAAPLSATVFVTSCGIVAPCMRMSLCVCEPVGVKRNRTSTYRETQCRRNYHLQSINHFVYGRFLSILFIN